MVVRPVEIITWPDRPEPRDRPHSPREETWCQINKSIKLMRFKFQKPSTREVRGRSSLDFVRQQRVHLAVLFLNGIVGWEFNEISHRSHPKCCLESMQTWFETGVLKLDDLVKNSYNEHFVFIEDFFFWFACFKTILFQNHCQLSKKKSGNPISPEAFSRSYSLTHRPNGREAKICGPRYLI